MRLTCANGGKETQPGAFATSGRCFFSRGEHTLKVATSIHQKNRAKLVARVQPSTHDSTWLVFRGGISRERNDSDHEELFRQESYFQYLFGVREPDWYGAIEVATGKAILFAPKLPAEYAVWMGPIATREALSSRYGVEVAWIDDMADKLRGCALCLKGTNTDSGVDIAEALPVDPALATPSNELYEHLADCRVVKSDDELEVMSYATYATSMAHVAVMRSTKVGDYEYQLEARFLAHIAEAYGCRYCAYTSICACGAIA